uniref:Uncharacterized protein n=1 Tax=Oryza glumipatula TaxID=40148 RepID=A0A0E0AZG7_9ORYZ
MSDNIPFYTARVESLHCRISAKAFGAKALPRQQRERLGRHAGTMLAPVPLALTGTSSAPTALALSRRSIFRYSFWQELVLK